MTFTSLPLIAGSVSTVIFVVSYLPMLVKAVQTKDLTSYSPVNLMLTNLGNAVHSVYVFSLPVGPIWALHSFYAVAGTLMLIWYWRYTRGAKSGRTRPARAERLPLSTVRGLSRRAGTARSSAFVPMTPASALVLDRSVPMAARQK
ncbi:hypothetical protein [Amycolatopsis palatopharyngis]|uniref:hypothetical protein n=1 Tax=Amycolatopsis palatopharyngis TaxID=187982 RepID=UPI001B878EC4|nr:hypothetical protein [Amycolatopsis palatopharyngis]